ncbi:MAG TPA: CBS domain-containing protein [Amycolatopsis sp.]|nr:CBS domain-containing protein [Amycolatopsis sp.]
MQTRDIMTTPVIAVTSAASPAEAAEVMIDHGFTTLPVIDRHGRLVGVVTEADLVRPDLPDPARAAGDPDSGAMLSGPRTVAALMRGADTAVPASLDAAELARIMTESSVRVLPVVENGTLVGIVTFRDVLRGSATRQS